MTIKFPCPQCGRKLSAPGSAAGERRKCPNCRMKVEVPGSAASRDPRTTGVVRAGSGDVRTTEGKFVMVLDAGADAGMKELLFSVEHVDDESNGD